MARNSLVTIIADGVQTQFVVQFTGGFIDESHVTCHVEDEVDGTGASVNRPITFISAGLISVGGGLIAADTVVTFKRSTPIILPINDFAAGDHLDDISLDQGFDQILKGLQEVSDSVIDQELANAAADGSGVFAEQARLSAIASENSRIASQVIGDTIALDTNEAEVSAEAARLSAAAAATSETNAAASADSITDDVTATATNATNAEASATNAATAQAAAIAARDTSTAEAEKARQFSVTSSGQAANSAASATSAANSASSATSSESNAKSSENNAKTSENLAKGFEVEAEAHTVTAANSVSEAAAEVAKAKAEVAKAKAEVVLAQGQVTLAEDEVLKAAEEVTNAQTHSNTANTRANAAGASATAAATSATTASNALSLFNTDFASFNRAYLGANNSNPVTNANGTALIQGALYYNAIAEEMRVYSTSLGWVDVNSGIGGGTGGNDGADGRSAYQIATDNGFVGSVSAWLLSLVGADGVGSDGADGDDGESAYQLAVNNGFLGSEAFWLAGLNGSNGSNGTDGVDGVDGVDADARTDQELYSALLNVDSDFGGLNATTVGGRSSNEFLRSNLAVISHMSFGALSSLTGRYVAGSVEAPDAGLGTLISTGSKVANWSQVAHTSLGASFFRANTGSVLGDWVPLGSASSFGNDDVLHPLTVARTMPSVEVTANILASSSGGNTGLWIIANNQGSGRNRAEVNFRGIVGGILDSTGLELPTSATSSDGFSLSAGTVVRIIAPNDFRVLSAPVSNSVIDGRIDTKIDAITFPEAGLSEADVDTKITALEDTVVLDTELTAAVIAVNTSREKISGGSFTANNDTSFEWEIPVEAKVVRLFLEGLGITGVGSRALIQVGDSTGYANTGYFTTFARGRNSDFTAFASTSGFLFGTEVEGAPTSGALILTRMGTLISDKFYGHGTLAQHTLGWEARTHGSSPSLALGASKVMIRTTGTGQLFSTGVLKIEWDL